MRQACLALLVLLVSGCQQHAREHPLDGMKAALQRTTAAHVGALEPGSAAEQAALARFSDLVAEMSAERTSAMVPEVYADKVYFNDTLKEVQGAPALAAYFRRSLGGADQVHAQIVDVARSGTDYYVRWEMTIRFRKLADNEPTYSTGVSHLRFDGDGRIVFHQDYWDATAGFFQHVPVVGRLIGWVKGRL
jgi:limonene-1,2-epoxide hydrolase